MEREELDVLLTPRVLAAIEAEPAPQATTDVLARSTALRRAGFTPTETAVVLTQARLRRRAVRKFGPFAERMLFTQAGLEQATRLDVASHHAARFRVAGIDRIGDLGCGIGGDCLAFAGLELDVLAVEHDPVTAALASYNLAPFPSVRVEAGEAEDADLVDVTGAWVDPARRTAGHTDTRRVQPGEYSPPLEFAFDLANRIPTGVKLGPAFERDAIPDHAEAQWVSSPDGVAELALWFGDLRRPGIRRAALVLSQQGAAELTAPADSDDEAVGPVSSYLHEPDGAVIRARLIGDLARTTGTHPIAEGIAYLSGAVPTASPFMSTFAVDAALPFDRLKIRKELRARGIGRLEIKKRGVDLDPATFRTFLGLSGDVEATLIVTRTADRRTAFICHRVGDEGSAPADAD